MKILLLFLVILFTGCQDKVVKVYVDANGTEIKKDTPLPLIKMNYGCDERGYKYYSQRTHMYEIYLPLFENQNNGAHQVRCTKDLK